MSHLYLPTILCIVIALTQGLSAAEPEFKDIFNGKDLTGWVVEGAKETKEKDGVVPVWSAAEGMIHCTGKGYGFLRYDLQQYGDFVFHVEYRMTKGCNSGIGIRGTKYDGKAPSRPSFAAYEIQILDDSTKAPGNHTSGSLYRYVAPKVNATLPAGEWNIMEIECRGPQIRITLNEQVIHDLDQSKIEAIKNKPLQGYLCVQTHGKPIDFRNLRVKELASVVAKPE
jgi:Domain of Unknown Function (DUF1080)